MHLLNQYRQFLQNIAVNRRELSINQKILCTLFFAAFTGLCAQLRIYLPWTPIPITLQTFAVLLSGFILGKWFGGASQLLYLILGCSGIPWFANQQAGITILFGPTGGYLLGFILAAYCTGWLSDSLLSHNYNSRQFFITITVLYMSLIYGLGLLGLYVWYWRIQGELLSLGNLLLKGAIPFLLGDFLKLSVITVYLKC